DRENHHLPSIRFMQKDSDATSNRFRHMRVNFSARWINPTSMRLKDCHQPYRLIKRQRVKIRAQPSGRLRKFTITYAFYTHALGVRRVRNTALKLHPKPSSKWSIAFYNTRSERKSKFSPLLFPAVKANT